MERLVENRGEYLYLKLSGSFSLHELAPKFPDLLKILMEQRISKILIDCREMYGSYSRAERYLVNERLAELNIALMNHNRPPLKITSVLNEEMFDPGKFGETVAKNRGLQAYNTLNIEDAYKWLEVAPPKIPTQPA